MISGSEIVRGWFVRWAGSVDRTARASVRDILDGQERLFRARAAARTGEAAQLRERIGQARDEIAGLEAQAVSLREQDSAFGKRTLH